MERAVEVWSACADCGKAVGLLDTDWHHEDPADHQVVLVAELVATR